MLEPKNILTELLHDVADELCYDGSITIKPVTSNGSNFTSQLFLAQLSAPEKSDVNLFAKVAAIGEKMREMSPNDIFKTETYFYKVLLQKYKHLEEEFDISENDRLITPKFYASNDLLYKEAIVLENLTAKGFQVADRFEAMSSAYAFKGVQQLAVLHALSLALATHYPKDFLETEEVLKLERSIETLQKFMGNMIDSVIEATEEKNKSLVRNYINIVLHGNNLNALIKPSKIPIIVHGDYRGSNLMYKTNDNNLQIAILDFQTLHYGSIVYDLLYFILNGADKDFLDNCFDALIEHYYDEFHGALIKLKVKPDYSREDLNEELEQKLPLCLSLVFCTLLVVTVEADKAPKVDEDLGINSFTISPNERYKERLNGIIDYFIKKGIIT